MLFIAAAFGMGIAAFLSEDYCRLCLMSCHQINMAESATNGGTYTKAYCPNCKTIQPIRKDQTGDDVLEIVCTICLSLIATLYK
jgi:hypothetical protein